ncbi:DUF2799 domain-containing protein [Bacteriovoracaceae bacterium]|nr:DUF2799 domain-containing protein [Bacteriovoracaceae bacterium]
MFIMKIAYIFPFLFLLNSCASIDKSDCTQVNWENMGEEDGRMGATTKAKFLEYQKKCNEFGISADNKGYKNGYARGIKKYCTYENGYDVGSKGKDLPVVCSQLPSREFARGHKAGKLSYQEKKQNDEIMKSHSLSLGKVLGKQKKRACDWSSDCKMTDLCKNAKCAKSKKECSINSECTLNGRCIGSKCEF